MGRLLAMLAALAVLAGTTQGAAGSATLDGPIIYVPQGGTGTLFAYQEGSWGTPVATYTGLPFAGPILGITSQGDYLYIASGGAGGTAGTGSVLKWDMTTGTTVWNTALSTGVDMPAICPDGKLYVAQGEHSTSTLVTVMDSSTGQVTGTIAGAGKAPHDSICMPSGGLYLGARLNGYLKTPTGRVGPQPTGAKAGVRPFTVSKDESRVWITYSHYRGFAVGSTSTGRLLASVNFGPVPTTYKVTAPSHGISLNPDGSDVWVLDSPFSQVREYTATDTPSLVATVTLNHKDIGKEQNCGGTCVKSGWLLNTLDGRYLLVGDSGDIIDTATASVVGYCPALANDHRGEIEVDWSGGVPVATSTHFGIGR